MQVKFEHCVVISLWVTAEAWHVWVSFSVFYPISVCPGSCVRIHGEKLRLFPVCVELYLATHPVCGEHG